MSISSDFKGQTERYISSIACDTLENEVSSAPPSCVEGVLVLFDDIGVAEVEMLVLNKRALIVATHKRVGLTIAQVLQAVGDKLMKLIDVGVVVLLEKIYSRYLRSNAIINTKT